jgi:hypothetical protein
MSIFGTNIKLFFENVGKNIKEIEDLAWEKKEYMEFCQYLVVLFSFFIDERAATMVRMIDSAGE